MVIIGRNFDDDTTNKIWDLMGLPRVEYANEEEAWQAGWEGWSPDIKARIPNYLELYETVELTEVEKIYMMSLAFDMLHHDRVDTGHPIWQKMAAILRRDIELHFALMSDWVRFTQSILTFEGWLSPEEVNSQVIALVNEFQGQFRWNGNCFVHVK